MNHFSNKKFNLIKFGKGAITISSLALPALISTTTNAMIRNPRAVSTLFIRLGGGISSSSPTRNISALKTSSTSSTGICTSTSPKPTLSGEAYRKMASINTGGSSSMISARISSLQSSTIYATSTTSSPSSLPIPKGNVSTLARKFTSSSTTGTTTSSGSSKTSTPSGTGNVARLSQRFVSSTTSTTSPSGSEKTSTPSGTGNVARLSQRFISSTTSTNSPSSSSGTSSSTGKVASIRKMFGN